MNAVIVIRWGFQRGPVWGGRYEDTHGHPMRAAVRISYRVNSVGPSEAVRRLFFSLRSSIKALHKSSCCVREGFHKSLSLFVYGNDHRRKDQQGVAENLQEVAEARQGNE